MDDLILRGGIIAGTQQDLAIQHGRIRQIAPGSPPLHRRRLISLLNSSCRVLLNRISIRIRRSSPIARLVYVETDQALRCWSPN